MNDTQRQAFSQAFLRLQLTQRFAPDDALSVQAYFDALQGYDLCDVVAAARVLQRRDGEFPSAATWCRAADDARSTRVMVETLPPSREEPWREECRDCEDTGWEHIACEGDAACGRPLPHAAHTYAVACHCRARNRTYQRKCEEQRRHTKRRHAGSASR